MLSHCSQDRQAEGPSLDASDRGKQRVAPIGRRVASMQPSLKRASEGFPGLLFVLLSWNPSISSPLTASILLSLGDAPHTPPHTQQSPLCSDSKRRQTVCPVLSWAHSSSPRGSRFRRGWWHCLHHPEPPPQHGHRRGGPWRCPSASQCERARLSLLLPHSSSDLRCMTVVPSWSSAGVHGCFSHDRQECQAADSTDRKLHLCFREVMR